MPTKISQLNEVTAVTDATAKIPLVEGGVTSVITPANLAADSTFADVYVAKSLYDANSLVIADTDNTPIVLAVSASRFLGRKASGGIVGMTPTESTALLDAATTSLPGIVELATSAETITGTDTARAVTPAGGAAAYRQLTADVISVGANEMASQGGAPFLTYRYITPLWLLDGAAQEQVGGSFIVPPGWATVDIDIWWTNFGGGVVGNGVNFEVFVSNTADGATLDAAVSTTATAVAAPAQYVAKKTRCGTGVTVTPGRHQAFAIYRYGAADAFNVDIGVMSLQITRAS